MSTIIDNKKVVEERLEGFGLSQKEVQVYLALLELGSSTAAEISKKAGVKRSTAYVLLDALSQRGLIGATNRRGIRLFNPASPELLVHYLEENVRKFSEKLSLAKKILPELRSIYAGASSKPKVQFLEGVKGLETAYEDTLNSSETIRAYASIENMHRALPHYFPHYYKRRAARNVHIRAIFPDSQEARERIQNNEVEKREACLVPRDDYAFSPEINIYDNKIVFMSLVEKFALMIESRELADTLKKVFELSWQTAKKIDRSGSQTL